MHRRRLLIGAAAGGGVALAAWRWWPHEGVANPCRASLPPALANHELVRAAWEGIDSERCWDTHAHLLGTGDSGSGVWTNPELDSWMRPVQYAQRLFYLNAGCVHDAPGEIDRSYIERMHNLLDGMAPGCKLVLLAFDHAYTHAGERDLARSAFHTPDAYARRMAEAHPRQFEWAASIHPYRHDALAALESAVRHGARAIKWLPQAMGIDPASARCDVFYRACARLGVPLIAHAGKERAVHGAGQAGFGNPLRLRRALDHGVRVIVAHCASLGSDQDLDRGPNGPWVPSFELFARLMDDPRYARLVFGDLSALTQVNRIDPSLRRVLEREDWHPRLLNGSDYPLPGILPLYSTEALVQQGYIEPAAAPVLRAIREHNPLLFDFVLKRHVRTGKHRFGLAVFHTRDFFLPRSAAGAPA